MKKAILVVDDEDALRSVVTAELSKLEYTVLSAADGQEAIAMLQQHRFDLVLLDITMPNIDGIGVLKFMQEHDLRAKAVMLTALGDIYHAIEAKQHGAIDFITKPFNLDEVLTRVQLALHE